MASSDIAVGLGHHDLGTEAWLACWNAEQKKVLGGMFADFAFNDVRLLSFSIHPMRLWNTVTTPLGGLSSLLMYCLSLCLTGNIYVYLTASLRSELSKDRTIRSEALLTHVPRIHTRPHHRIKRLRDGWRSSRMNPTFKAAVPSFPGCLQMDCKKRNTPLPC